LNTELNSKSIPKIKKSASQIAKKHIEGFEKELVSALEFLMQKPKSWLAQSEVIKAIGITGSSDSVPYLLDLSLQEYDTSIIYRDLAFSICMLTDIKEKKLSYFDNILNSYNHMSISGACSALLYSGFIPKNQDIINILNNISEYTENEGQVITPRCYIAAACYSWPQELTKEFLSNCKNSLWSGLVEIANDSSLGKKTKYILV
jgi:hypothetical protein